MKRFIPYTALSILALCVVILLLIIFLPSKENNRSLTLYGNVDVRQVEISFRVPGQVKELFFEEGDFVKTDDLLAKMDPSPYDEEVRKAASNLAAIKADFSNAEILYQRRKELIGIGGVSQEDLDNAYTNRNQLEANLNASRSSLAIAKDNLSYTETKAPTEGIILTRIREPGTVVRESDPVYTLSVASPVWVRAFVSEVDLGRIAFGMKAEILTDLTGGNPYQGKIGFISPIAEFTPKTVQTTDLRTDLVYRLRIYVDNPDFRLKQGMPVTVVFKGI